MLFVLDIDFTPNSTSGNYFIYDSKFFYFLQYFFIFRYRK